MEFRCRILKQSFVSRIRLIVHLSVIISFLISTTIPQSSVIAAPYSSLPNSVSDNLTNLVQKIIDKLQPPQQSSTPELVLVDEQPVHIETVYSTFGTCGAPDNQPFRYQWNGVSGRMMWVCQGGRWQITRSHLIFNLLNVPLNTLHIQVCSKGDIPYREWDSTLGFSPVHAAPNYGGFGSWGTQFAYKDWHCVDQSFNLKGSNVLKIGHFWGFEGRNADNLQQSTMPTAQYNWYVWVKRINDTEFAEPFALFDRSTLSTNTPKNGLGDPRECAIDGCANAVATAGDPIDTRTGNFDYSLVDLSVQTIAGPLTLQRSYASQALTAGLYSTEMSPGWTHNQDIRLMIEGDTVWFKGHTLNQYRFSANLDGTYTPYPGVLANLTKNNQNTTAPEDDVYTLTGSDQSVYTFDYTRKLQSWRNELDYGFEYSYASDLLDRVTEPTSGRYLQFNYQSGRLASVNDPTSRQVIFGYDANGDLTSFTDARGKTWTYEYDGTSHRLASVVEPSASAGEILRIVYDAQGRATEQFDGANQRIVKITFNTDGTSTIEDALGREATHSYDHRNTNTGRADTSGYTLQKTYDANFRPDLVKDQDNRTLQYTWSANGANLTHIQDAANYETSLQYDAGNHLTQVKDPLYDPAVPNNHVIDYAYTGTLLTGATRQTVEWGPITTSYTYTTTADAPQPVDLLKTITDALGHTTHLIYDAAGQLVSIQDAELHTTQFAYDNLGRVTDVTDPLGRVTHTQYDGAGNVTKVIQNYDTSKAQNAQNLYNLTTEFFYDEQGRFYQTLDTLGATTTYTYDAAGRVYQVIDDNGKTSTSVYNAAGQLNSVSDPLGHSTGYEYDSAGRLWKIKDALNRVILTYAYNPDSTLLTETYPTPTGDYVVTYETYDALKRPTRVSDNAGHVSEVMYDAYGNPLTRTDALGRVTKYEYNDLGLLSAVVQNYKTNPGSGDDPNATNARTEYAYDKAGNLKKIKDANGHETIYDYDVLNRLWKITDPLGHVTEFGYDALGNRTSLKDANNQTTIFNYDIANRLDIIDYPSGMTDVDFGYDPLGRLTGMDDSLGHTTWAYDNLSRVTSITDPFNKTVGYGYDDDGKRANITYPAPVNKTITYQYTALDQLEHVLEGTTHLADYTYDVAGRLSGVTLANGVAASMGYDLSGQITNLAYTKGTNQLAQYVYQYGPVGNRENVQETVYYPHFVFLPAIRNDGEGGQMQSLAEGAESSELDAAAEAMGGGYPAPGEEPFLESPAEGIEPQDSEAPYPAPQEPGGSETSFFQKIWDFVARLFVDRTPTVSAHSDPQSGYPAPNTQPPASPSNTPQTIHYEYDALNRLTGADYTTGQDYAFTYDKVGNRTSQTVGAAITAYQYDAADRLTNAGGVTFTWDNNGNLLNDGVNTYSYDFANRLAAVSGQGSSFSFGYDGLDNRYQQTVNGQTSTYILDQAAGLSQVLYESAPQGAGTSYYYGLGRISQQKNGITNYFLTDALGSVRQITNQTGSVTLGQAYDPFGNTLGWSGQGGFSYGYAGEWTDSSGLQYLRARYYSPSTGRFVSKDPFPGLLTQPASLTPYVYALNSPVLYSDPSGEFVETLFDAVSLGYDIYTIGDKLNRSCSLHWSDWTALGLDALSLAIPFLPAAGMAVRFAAHADDIGDVARIINKSVDAAQVAKKMEAVREAGRSGEALAEIVKNTTHIDSLTHTATYRIPDQLNLETKIISEVKNVNRLSLTNQIKDYVAFARSNRYTFELWVRETTKFSQPLQKLIDDGEIILRYLEVK